MNTLLSMNYRRISATQIKHAAIRIQKTFRGYSTRNLCWSFGGILSQSVTLKIQRVYRGHVGRTKARALYHAYRSKKAMILQCFWRQCIARRMVRLLNAIRINRMATKIMKQWRGRCVRKIVLAMRLLIRIKQATKIQKSYRLYVGRCRSYMIRTGLMDGMIRRSQVYREHVTSAFGPMTSTTGNILDDWTIMSPSELCEYVLVLLTVTRKLERAALVSSFIVHRWPQYVVGRFVRCLVLLKLWPSVTKIGYMSEELLQEAFYLMVCVTDIDRKAVHDFECTILRAYLNAVYGDSYVSLDLALLRVLKVGMRVNWGCDWLGAYSGNFIKPIPFFPVDNNDEDGSNPVATVFRGVGYLTSKVWRVGGNEKKLMQGRLQDILEEQKVGLLKNIKRSFRAAAESLSIGRIDSLCSGSEDSAILLLKQDAAAIADDDDDEEEGDGNKNKGLTGPLGITAAEEAALIDLDSPLFRSLRMVNLHMEVVENVFCKTHTVLLAKERASTFGVSMPSHWKHTAPGPPRKWWTRAYFQVEQCGGLLFIKATMFNKAATVGGSREQITVRPLVLRPEEVEHMATASTDFLVQTLATYLRRPTEVIRQRGIWMNIAEFCFLFTHFVPCGNSLSACDEETEIDSTDAVPDNHNEMVVHTPSSPSSNVHDTMLAPWRVALPVVEYWRAQRDALREQEYSVRLLQRILRGTRARTLANRLLFRAQMKARQAKRTGRCRDNLSTLRKSREISLARIMAIYRGWNWRRKLAKWKYCCLVIQCCFRIYRAKKKMWGERMRATLGPPVEVVLTRIMIISGIELTLSVYRCGDNYKLRGSKKIKPSLAAMDLRRKQKRAGAAGSPVTKGNRAREYVAIEGSVFEADIQILLQAYNRHITETLATSAGAEMLAELQQRRTAERKASLASTKTTSVKKPKPIQQASRADLLIGKWQYRRVAELMVAHLKIVRASDVAPNDLSLNGGRGSGFAQMGELTPDMLVLERLRGHSLVVTAPPYEYTLAKIALLLLDLQDQQQDNDLVIQLALPSSSPTVPAPSRQAAGSGAAAAAAVRPVDWSLEEVAKRPLRRVLRDQKGWIDTLDTRLLQSKLGMAGYDQYDVFKRMAAPSSSVSASSLLAAAALVSTIGSATVTKRDPYSLSPAADRINSIVRQKERPKPASSNSMGSLGSATRIAPVLNEIVPKSPLRNAGAAIVGSNK